MFKILILDLRNQCLSYFSKIKSKSIFSEYLINQLNIFGLKTHADTDESQDKNNV